MTAPVHSDNPSDDAPAIPTPRERMAERLCQAAVHMHLEDENPSWREMWLRLADVALAGIEQEADE